MAIQFMADDSGCKGSTRDAVMGGLLGQAKEWADFSDRWDACIHETPSIPYFKMHDAMHRTGGCSTLTETQAKAKTFKLAEILNEKAFKFDALHVTVDTAAYSRAVENASGVG